ncbi:copper resistance protein CopC [Cohnella algarum]|uniref:copper resistance protein CopC n=1 Tax=Cohnella algarum TaxID=2044859 RepID=UPI00196772DB|nr:copper resistance protein CopC [Cohnella algarum]
MKSRFKAVSWLLLIGLFAFPAFVFAHSTAETVVPGDAEVVEAPLPEVSVAFNTTVELVSLKVSDASGAEQPFKETGANGETITGVFEQPLARNGTYSVQWHIIGADGHAIKGESSFEVRIAAPPESPVATEDTAVESAVPTAPAPEQGDAAESPAASEASPSSEAQLSPSPEAGGENAASSGDNVSDLSVWIVGAAALLLVAAIGFSFANKRKKG